MSRVWRQDLVWAGFILGIAVLLGLAQQWPLVRQSWRGELAARLEQVRSQRRQEQFQGVKTINLPQAYAQFQGGQALFIDARKPDEYAELHISKALNITPSMLEAGGAEKVAGLAKDREIVVYCDQVSCDLALRVAEQLQALGFTRVTAFVGGFKAWDEAGYPADTSK
ncbi:MAG: rhodanese-like domain-containing protein [Desulfobaccales bacterium]